MEAQGYVRSIRLSVGHARIIVVSVAACIRDDEGRIMLVRRAGEDGLWGFPGGAVELGESVPDALAREVMEEVRLEVRPTDLVGVYSTPEYSFRYPNGDEVQPVTIFVECDVLRGRPSPDGTEVAEVRYFGQDNILPSMRPCCVAKARDAFAFRGSPFLR